MSKKKELFFLFFYFYLKARERYKRLIYNDYILIKKIKKSLITFTHDVMSERFFADDKSSSCN